MVSPSGVHPLISRGLTTIFRMQLLLPASSHESSMFADSPQMEDVLRSKYGSYETRTAVTNLSDIGKFVARIVDDPRSLNQYVFCWGDEVTQATVIKTIDALCPTKIEFIHVGLPFSYPVMI